MEEQLKDPNEENTLEENFRLLDDLIARLSDENISLDEAFDVYTRGMGLLKLCNDQIDRVEKKVLKLNEEGGLSPL